MTVRLIHVGVQESLAQRIFPDNPAPAWAGGGADSGVFQLRRWAEDQAMATLTASLSGEEHVVSVTVAALYEFADEPIPSGDTDLRSFYKDHIAEMMPFLRQAVHAASSQVWPIRPIMMDTAAATEGEAEQRRRPFDGPPPREENNSAEA